ncbi:MAG: integrin alpha [Deltaproteobacteria bacterium]|nr:integrin alpha [Deltaproteobacteria bacterium]
MNMVSGIQNRSLVDGFEHPVFVLAERTEGFHANEMSQSLPVRMYRFIYVDHFSLTANSCIDSSGPADDPAAVSQPSEHTFSQTTAGESSFSKTSYPDHEDGSVTIQNTMVSFITSFDESGIVLHDAQAERWVFGFRINSIGHNEAVDPVKQVEPAIIDCQCRRDDHCVKTIEYDRNELIEWYVARPSGIEQRFALFVPLSGDEALRITAYIDGDLLGNIADNGLSAVFSLDGADVLEYTNIRAWDAKGMELAVWLEAEPASPASDDVAQALDLVVDDSSAVYPIQIVSGITAAPNWGFESNVANVAFGWAIAGMGDINKDGYDDVLISAPQYSEFQTWAGRVYVFYGSAAGLPANYSQVLDSGLKNSEYGKGVNFAGRR